MSDARTVMVRPRGPWTLQAPYRETAESVAAGEAFWPLARMHHRIPLVRDATPCRVTCTWPTGGLLDVLGQAGPTVPAASGPQLTGPVHDLSQLGAGYWLDEFTVPRADGILHDPTKPEYPFHRYVIRYTTDEPLPVLQPIGGTQQIVMVVTQINGYWFADVDWNGRPAWRAIPVDPPTRVGFRAIEIRPAPGTPGWTWTPEWGWHDHANPVGYPPDTIYTLTVEDL